jgi:hypothetical protein
MSRWQLAANIFIALGYTVICMLFLLVITSLVVGGLVIFPISILDKMTGLDILFDTDPWPEVTSTVQVVVLLVIATPWVVFVSLAIAITLIRELIPGLGECLSSLGESLTAFGDSWKP